MIKFHALLMLSMLGFADAQSSATTSQQKFVINSIGMKLVPIPAGTFLMGSSAKDAREDEQPRHQVIISHPFHMGAFEVTQELYAKVTGIRKSFFAPTGGGRGRVKGMDTRSFPVEQIRWYDAMEFCRKLSELPAEKKAGRVYRLPTEAEWEYACRAGTNTAFAFGNSLSSKQATFNGEHPYGGAKKGPFRVRTTRVGSFAPNAFGLYDMHGNVWEWCLDWYDRSYYKKSPKKDPLGPKSGSVRVIRGGGWYADGFDCRSAFRYADIPGGIFYVMGFRVVMVQKESPNDYVIKDAKPNVERLAKLATRDNNPATQPGEDWPQWRGPRGNGTWKGPKLLPTWREAGLRTIWRQPIGGGYSGVSVAEGRVYTLDYHKKPASIERVLCFDAVTGRRLWSHSYPVDYRRLAYPSGPRTAPTVFDGKVYTLGAVGHLFCFDGKSGNIFWSKDVIKDFGGRRPGWGFSASPLVFENLLILQIGAEPNGCLVAIDRATGKEKWRSLSDEAGYATPTLVRHRGHLQLVCWTPSHIRSVDPRTGKLNWSFPYVVTYGTAIASPVYHEGVVFVSGYYEGSKAIQLGDSPSEAKLIWQENRDLRGLMSTPLYRDGYGYLLDKRLGVTCFEMKTGKKWWDDGNRMTPKGRNPQATMIWTGRGAQVLALNSEGFLIQARLNPTGYKELSRTKIIGSTWAHPAFAGHCVYARSDSELVCVALTETAKPPRKQQ